MAPGKAEHDMGGAEHGIGGYTPFKPEHYHVPTPEQRLSDQLGHFLQRYIGVLHENTHIEQPELTRRAAFLQDFYNPFIQERNERAVEVESPRTQAAIETIKELLPYENTFGVFCVDGRIVPSVVFGFPGGYGGFMRSPSGDMGRFRQKKGGGLVLMEDSTTAELIDESFKKRGENGPLCQILDSHVGCAARGRIEARRGRPESPDGGLFEDVMRKKKIGSAMKEYVKEKYGEGKMIPIQFSFDPHNGYGYMGHEKRAAIAEVQRQEREGHLEGYTSAVLAKLADEGTILSTKKIAEELLEQFDTVSQGFKIHWEKRYEESVDGFWKRMQMLVNGPASEIIAEKVRRVYGDISDDEIRQRSVLLLANAYNGYLQNGNQISGDYPRGTHKEACPVIQEQGFGPHGINDFSVFPSNYLAEDTVFASEIIRTNRLTKSIEDFTGNYSSEAPGDGSVNEFVGAPIPVVLKGIIRGADAQKIQDHHWESLLNIDWSQMPGDWHSMSDDDFAGWLETQDSLMPSIFVSTLNTMRNRMAKLYDGGSNISVLMAEGSLTVLPVVVDSSRRIRAIIPFIHEGYSAAA